MGRPAASMSRNDEVVQLFLKDAGRVYVHQDANFNVTTLTDITGRVLERYFYSPYGQLEAVISSHPFDYDDDGDVDANDASVCLICSGDYVGDCRLLDADGDRDVDYDDQTIIDAYVAGLSGDTALTRVPSSPRSRLGNPFAHQGLPLDAEIASYQNRARQYNPGLKRFMQRDPLASGPQSNGANSGGANSYEYADASPLDRRDPTGLMTFNCTGSCPGTPNASCVYATGWSWQCSTESLQNEWWEYGKTGDKCVKCWSTSCTCTGGNCCEWDGTKHDCRRRTPGEWTCVTGVLNKATRSCNTGGTKPNPCFCYDDFVADVLAAELND